MTRSLLFSVLLSVLLFSLLAPPAMAGDGRIEINQARALAGGVSASDSPGFPVTLEQYGNYVLTSNLLVPLDSDGIEVDVGLSFETAGIRVDLNGFSVLGPGECSGDPLECTGLGGGSSTGIDLRGDDITIRNGSIRGFGFDGIRVVTGDRHRFSHLSIRENGGFGIRNSSSDGDYVEAIIVSDNFTGGIRADNQCLILDSLVVNNGGIGIDVGAACRVSGNTIDTGSLGTLGLRLVTGLGAASGYSNNTITSSSGIVSGGVDAGGNVCNGSTTCP